MLDDGNVERLAERARGLMRGGGLVVYPTDTVYGLGTDARIPANVERVYAAKGRPRSKPISVAVSTLEQVEELAELDEGVRTVLSRLMPGPYTVVLRSSGRFPHLSRDGKIGLRIPGNAFTLLLCRDFPVTCTSANLSGEPSPRAVSEVTVDADLVLDGGTTSLRVPSTVFGFIGGECRLLRAGSGSIDLLSRAVSDAGLGELVKD